MKAARAVWDGLIRDRSVIGRLLVMAGFRCLDHETRQSVDDDLLSARRSTAPTLSASRYRLQSAAKCLSEQ
jgi:hypothetical protein